MGTESCGEGRAFSGAKIRDMERRLRRLGILGIAIGLAVIGGNLVILILIPGFMPPWGFAIRVLGILVGTTVLFTGMLCLISARGLAQRRLHGFEESGGEA